MVMNQCAARALLAAAVCSLPLVGCAASTTGRGATPNRLSTAGASPATAAVDATLSCEPSPRLRLGGVEYEVRTFDGVVAEQDVGEVFAEDLVLPSAITDCVPFVVLRDGEGSLPAGTTVYEIVGVDPAEALTASYGTATTSGSWPTPNPPVSVGPWW